jgi:hypothetical protein
MSGSVAAVAAEHYTRGETIVRTFPAEIQEVLQRRSSRDPTTRFVRKLHVLLSYISANPHLESEAGIGWIDDSVFKIFKPRLIGVLGLKVNTLNVNLRELHFVQLQSDKSGWTRWRREGFTRRDFDITSRSTNDDEILGGQPDFFGGQHQHLLKDFGGGGEKFDFRISYLSPPQKDVFDHVVLIEWQTIIESHEKFLVATEFFVSRAAGRYRIQAQSAQNAYDVLHAILAPQDQTHVKMAGFYRFMAMFGPTETLMLKIHSLLEVATANTPWLYFGTPPGPDPIPFGAFDEDEPNSLVIRKGNQELDRVWNIPLVPFGEPFIVDKNDQKYMSWQEYFRQHPVPDDSPFPIAEMDAFH